MNEFKSYHPVVNLIYFVAVIGFSCALMHPVFLMLSFWCAFLYLNFLKGRQAVKSLIYILPTFVIMALVNPLFNHEGVTIIAYFPNGNPLTLESVIYGISASVMIISVILFFSCYNEVMTSDKFIYLFGKVIPSLALVISMTLRFVPAFTAQLKKVVNSQKCIGRDISSGSVIKRAKCGLSILSIMVTWSLENAVTTADSMKSRGYGVKKRTSYSIYRLDKRDLAVLLVVILSAVYVLAGVVSGAVDFSYFPYIKASKISLYGISVFLSYMVLCAIPIIIELVEVRRWKSIKSKI